MPRRSVTTGRRWGSAKQKAALAKATRISARKRDLATPDKPTVNMQRRQVGKTLLKKSVQLRKHEEFAAAREGKAVSARTQSDVDRAKRMSAKLKPEVEQLRGKAKELRPKKMSRKPVARKPTPVASNKLAPEAVSKSAPSFIKPQGKQGRRGQVACKSSVRRHSDPIAEISKGAIGTVGDRVSKSGSKSRFGGFIELEQKGIVGTGSSSVRGVIPGSNASDIGVGKVKVGDIVGVRNIRAVSGRRYSMGYNTNTVIRNEVGTIGTDERGMYFRMRKVGGTGPGGNIRYRSEVIDMSVHKPASPTQPGVPKQRRKRS